MSDYSEARIQEFIDAIRTACWDSPSDAQWENIRDGYTEFVHDKERDSLQSEVERLKK